MKTNKILALGFAALMMASCSSDEPIGPGTGSSTDLNGRYISVRLGDANSSPLSKASINFEDGTANEKRIDFDKLRFFIFDSNGAPYLMKREGGDDSNMIAPIFTQNDNVNNNTTTTGSTNISATIILTNPASTSPAALPARIVAVANVNPADVTAYEGLSCDELLTLTHSDYKSADNAFIMTSAAWWTNSKNTFWSEITPDNICATADAAKDHPVHIFIERIVSKVEIESFPESGMVYESADATEAMTITLNTVDGAVSRKLYVAPIGWTVNTLTDKAYGIKHLENYDFFTNVDGNAWSEHGRSYWETSVAGSTPELFTPGTAFSNEAGAAGVYVSPNTNDRNLSTGEGARKGESNYALSNATKILVGVKVFAIENTDEAPSVQADGTPIMKFAGQYYTPEAICKYLTTEQHPVVSYVRDEVNTYNVKFYYSNDASKAGYQTSIEGLTAIPDTPEAEFWNGRGYYILNVSGTRLMNNNKEAYGMVRNQIYRYALKKFIGLGTPIVDPTLEVLPENPESSNSYIASKLHVYRWRVISKEANLQ